MASATKPTVLIVDDDPAIRRMLVELLQLEGYPTETATNGQEAIELLTRNGSPRIVLLDILMPVKNGREVMLELRSQPSERAKHKILLVSANQTLEANRDLQPDGTIAKPFSAEVLLNTVATLN